MKKSSFTFIHQVWVHLIRPYWTSQDRWIALTLLSANIACIGLFVYLSICLNYWNNDFYTALQELNGGSFFRLLGIFALLAFLSICIFIAKSYFLQTLEIRWRTWMTKSFIEIWTHNHRYYSLQLAGEGTDNPDQRIAEDTHYFISRSLSLSLSFFQHICTLVTFLGVLWTLSGDLEFTFAGFSCSIPGYMCWAALLYAIGGSFVSYYLGRPLIGLNYEHEKREANFRYSLIRFRENMEGIALYQGESHEKGTFLTYFGHIVNNFYDIINRSLLINTWHSFYSQVNAIFPLLLGAPRLFSKKLTFGGLMQTLSAFREVSHAFSFIVDNYSSIASWRATTNRLLEFKQSLEASPIFSLEHTKHKEEEIHVFCESISLPNGKIVNKNVELLFKKNEHTLITGPTGIGKSTLARVIAGLWIYGKGTVKIPFSSFLFLPQKPYMPLGSLESVLHYPSLEKATAETREVLRAVGLSSFTERLKEVNDWSRILSIGEQQRIAVARALLIKPHWLFLDEATSAMDEVSEAQLYYVMKAYLPETTLISIGHRESLKSLHNREIRLRERQIFLDTAVA